MLVGQGLNAQFDAWPQFFLILIELANDVHTRTLIEARGPSQVLRINVQGRFVIPTAIELTEGMMQQGEAQPFASPRTQYAQAVHSCNPLPAFTECCPGDLLNELSIPLI